MKFQFSLNNTNDRRKEVLCLRDWRVYLEISVNETIFLLINTIRQVSIQLFQFKFDGASSTLLDCVQTNVSYIFYKFGPMRIRPSQVRTVAGHFDL